MSEYQYYEFQAVDKPLTERQMAALRAISTRATITPTSFVNTYNWGDLKADPRSLVTKYFDAHLYVANWGSHRFMLRVPSALFDAEAAAPFCAQHGLSAESQGGYTLLDFWSEDEDGDWETGEGCLASLIPLRADILAGDLRALYLGWLLAAQNGEINDDELEPLLPPGCPSLRELSAPLKALADFLRVGDDLVMVAAEGLPPDPIESSPAALESWIGALPSSGKDALLLRVADGEGHVVRCELLKRFRESRAPEASSAAREAGRRTVAQLLERRDVRAAERERREAEKRAKEAARRAEGEARARAEHLDSLAGREAELWRRVEELIRATQPRLYNEAVALLTDLRDLSRREGSAEEFQSRLAELRERHHNKPSLRSRLDRAGL
jgi:hypothetical protein